MRVVGGWCKHASQNGRCWVDYRSSSFGRVGRAARCAGQRFRAPPQQRAIPGASGSDELEGRSALSSRQLLGSGKKRHKGRASDRGDLSASPAPRRSAAASTDPMSSPTKADDAASTTDGLELGEDKATEASAAVVDSSEFMSVGGGDSYFVNFNKQ